MQRQPKRPRLVHIATVPESLGFLVGQPAYMRKHGFEVTAISSDGSFGQRFSEQEAVQVHVVNMHRRMTPLRDLVALAEVYRLLRLERPCIVHGHTPKGGLIAMVSAWLARVPVRIYHIHGLPLVTATGWKRRILTWTERISCRMATDVLCVSPSVRDVAVRERLNGNRDITVLCAGSINGVDALGRFNPARHREGRAAVRRKHGIPLDAPVLGFVGRIVRDKGISELLQAWRELRTIYPDLHLLAVGPFESQDPIPPEDREAMERDPRVHLHGVDYDTAPLFAAMDVLVLPTYREGFPVVPLEGAAMELPVVATAIPGCTDAVKDGVTGVLVPPRDPGALLEAIRRYASDPMLRAAHGRAGRERVMRHFRPEQLWEATLNLYLHTLARESVEVQESEWCSVAHDQEHVVAAPAHTRASGSI